MGENGKSALEVFQEVREEAPLASVCLKRTPHLSRNQLHTYWYMLESPDWLSKNRGVLCFGIFVGTLQVLILSHKYLNFEYLFLGILSADLHLLEEVQLLKCCLHLFQCSMAG